MFYHFFHVLGPLLSGQEQSQLKTRRLKTSIKFRQVTKSLFRKGQQQKKKFMWFGVVGESQCFWVTQLQFSYCSIFAVKFQKSIQRTVLNLLTAHQTLAWNFFISSLQLFTSCIAHAQFNLKNMWLPSSFPSAHNCIKMKFTSTAYENEIENFLSFLSFYSN